MGTPLAGALSDRFGRQPVAIAAGTAMTGLALAFYNGSGPWLAPLWVALIFFLRTRETALSAFGAELFPASHRSTAAGAR